MQKDKRADEYIKKNKLYVTRTYADGTDYKVPCFQDIPTDIIAEYAAHDARIAYDLNLIYESKLTPEANDAIAIEQEMVNICYKMEKLGLMVDEGYTARAMEFESNKIVDGMLQYQELTGAQFVNSAKSVQPHLSRELPKTEDGNPSLNDDVVEAILADTAWSDKDHKIVQTVRFIRGYQKRVSTYYQSYLNLMDSNNIIHPSMWSAGTRTGRFSYSDPNLQNIPKEEDSTDEFVVRGCFRPRPGNKFVSFDYSQMEYKLAADYAGEMGVLAQVASGADFHQATADMVGIPRKQAKTLNFAVLYGAGIEKIAGMLGVSQTDAKRLKDKYFMGLPKVEKLIDQVIATGRERGYVKTWTGRRMYADREFCYALPNHLIQSGGADVCKKAMIEIHRELGHLWMVLQVHDQLVFDMPPEHMKYIPQIKEIMESQYKSFHGVRLTVDVSVSSKSLAERDMEKYVDTSKT
jgi:DNA polymerase-1